MNNHIVFAASYQDAKAAIETLGLKFDETTWVMNAQLLGGGDYSGHEAHYTDLFRQMPAFVDAAYIFGDTHPEVSL